ncbi:MAG: GNAT family N-acetyltransferase [Opitutaceae bacterium]|nr:GNAT family N-acetyltransferase [Opitutaceae bacterium]
MTCRPATAADTAFLREVYAASRAEELAPLPWPAAAKQAFLDQQAAAQDHSYRHNYPGADFLVILVDATPAGRLYLHARPSEIRIMDIALLPAFRGLGFGSALLRRIQELGTASGRAVSIHVETFNPARRLYERLGFRPAGQTEVYLLLEWLPSVTAPPPPAP